MKEKQKEKRDERIWQTNMHTHIRHHHRHMAQYITTHQYHNTNLHRHGFPQPKKIHLPLYFCLCISVYFPTHIPSNLIREARASFPGERVNVRELPLHCHSAAALLYYSTKIFRKIDPSRLFSALRLPTEPSMDHPVVC